MRQHARCGRRSNSPLLDHLVGAGEQRGGWAAVGPTTKTFWVCGVIRCGDYNANEVIEKGAEVFAAEFIYPEAEFASDIAPLGIKTWQPKDVVHVKRACKAKVSYRFICKRLERLQLIPRGAFSAVRFQKLEEQLFGVPFYRRRTWSRAS